MLLLSRNYVFRVDLSNRDYSGPSERVRLVTCRLTYDYPTKEFHHYWKYVSVRKASSILKESFRSVLTLTEVFGIVFVRTCQQK